MINNDVIVGKIFILLDLNFFICKMVTIMFALSCKDDRIIDLKLEAHLVQSFHFTEEETETLRS